MKDMTFAPSCPSTARNAFRQQEGIAMITVLLTTTIALLLAVTFSLIALSESRSTRATVRTEEAVQLADAGSERARRQIIASFNNTFLSIANFLTSVDSGSIAELSGVRTLNIDGTDIHWQVIGVSDPGAAYGWIDVASTAELPGNSVQTVVRRVGFGASSTFDLAMLSETTDCMFCHLRVNGDVGNLVFMRPGWGREGATGKGSGGSITGLGGSIVRGNVFAAQDVTDDRTSENRLNGAVIEGVVERNSTNSSLPRDLDGDGIADFPPINREVAKLNALGSIGGGSSSCLVPIGGTFSGNCGTANYNGTINGNLILEGTRDNPIAIEGDVWVEGDVIIKGYVQGLGGLYAGRNVYLAGDVQSVNAAYRVDSAGQCVNEAGEVTMTVEVITATGFSPSDACARRSIADETDALRIGARGSIILGDYTEYNADDSLKSPAGLQSSEFYRQQFGFTRNQTRHYDRSNGDELRCTGNGHNCYNADNILVTNTVPSDAYSASFRPGSIASTGFNPWMTDAQYLEILGTEVFDHNSWRWEYANADFTNGKRIAEALAGLIAAGFHYDEAVEMLGRKVNYQGLATDTFSAFRTRAQALDVPLTATSASEMPNIDRTNGAHQTLDDNGERARYEWSDRTLRVIHTAEREYETQVNRVDAFLYANQRIAGKTSMQAMSITGGLVARDLGILAPGRRLELGRFGGNFARDFNLNLGNVCSKTASQYYVYGSEDCALTVNYDHRLRNGGYGYNIIEGRVGITLDWRLADRKDERVQP